MGDPNTMMIVNQASVSSMVDALHTVVAPGNVLYFDWAVFKLASLSPALGALPAALNRDEVWDRSRRVNIMEQVSDFGRFKGNFRNANPGGIDPRSGKPLTSLLADAQSLARQDGFTEIRAWHLAKALIEADTDRMLPSLGINTDALLERVAELEGRIELGPQDAAKSWYFSDANVFLQYQMFDEVNWTKELGEKAVVLVVPTAVLRALDHYKNDRAHERQSKRARQVLPRLADYALASAPGVPAAVRRGVELLLRDREPQMPVGFDAADPDDRIIADALDFKWAHPGSQVIVLSGDTTVRIKARSNGLRDRKIPDHLELESVKPRVDSTEISPVT